jgi:signal peptidase I
MDIIEEKIIKRKKKFLEVIKYTTLMIVSFLAFRSSFYEPYMIPSGSMIPSLHIGDFILVDKYEYGLKVPFSDIAMLDVNLEPKYFTKQSLPQRGDMIVFKYPKDPSINYIKRVIGLPGDTIEVKEKIVYINGEPMDLKEVDGSKFIREMERKYQGNRFKFYKTKLGNKEFIIQQDIDNIYTSYLDKTVIPEDAVFVMGDNRDFSSDSREWGHVPLNYIRGKAVMVWFSMTLPDQGENFKIRSERIFMNLN